MKMARHHKVGVKRQSANPKDLISVFQVNQTASRTCIVENQRNRKFEVMESATHALREAQPGLDVSERLMFETLRLIHSQHAAVLLIDAQGKLQCEFSHGPYTEMEPITIPRGQGLSVPRR